MPSGCSAEAPVRHALPVTADVVDPAGQRQRREERAPGIGDVQRGAEVAPRLVEPGARAVEQPKPQHDAASAGAREALSLLFGNEGGTQDRQDLADRRVLRHGAVRRVDECDRGLDIDRRTGCDRRVDEDSRRVRAKPVVFAPRVRIRDLLDRADPRRQVQDAVDVAHGVGDSRGVEEVELLVRGHRELVARGVGEGLKGAAEHATSPGDKQTQRRGLQRFEAWCRSRLASHSLTPDGILPVRRAARGQRF